MQDIRHIYTKDRPNDLKVDASLSKKHKANIGLSTLDQYAKNLSWQIKNNKKFSNLKIRR